MISRKKFFPALMRLAAAVAAAGFFIFSVPMALAADIGPPPTVCWLPIECLGQMPSGGSGGQAQCSTNHCYAADSRCPAGQGKCFTNPPPIPLVIHIGSAGTALDLGDYIAKVYNYSFLFASILAAVMFIVGGFQYLTAGASDRLKAAKQRIVNSLVGLLLLMGSFTILNTINPDILKLQMPKIEVTKKSTYASCAFTENCFPCGVKYNVLTEKGTGKTASSTSDCQYATLKSDYTGDKVAKYDLSAECIGKGCGPVGAPDAIPVGSGEGACTEDSFRCKSAPTGATSAPTFACGHQPDAAKAANSTYSCQSCKRDGEDCGGQTGPNDDCCGGYCAQTTTGNKCASGEPGDTCQNNNQCKSGKCQTNWSNSCSNGAVGSPCDDKSECKTGYVCSTTYHNTCSPGTEFSFCGGDDECQTGLHCVKIIGYDKVCIPNSVQAFSIASLGAFKAAVCNPTKSGTGADCCDTNADCASLGGYCNTDGNNFCTDGSVGAPCEKGDQCASGKCVVSHWFGSGVCTDGENGSICTESSQCDSGFCYTSGDFGNCTSGGVGAHCASGTGCKDGLICSADQRCISKPAS